MLMAGCGHRLPASVSDGLDKVIEAPEYEIRGATTFDQRWIDRAVAAGVASLNWPLPKPRPAELDAPAKKIAPIVKPAKKPTFRDRLGRALHKGKQP